MRRCTQWFTATATLIAPTWGIAQPRIGEAPDAIRAGDPAGPPGGGIAGVGYFENFESVFQYGYGCGQGGWTCASMAPPFPGGDFEIIDHADPSFGEFSLQDRAAGHSAGIQEFRSPIFALETGGIYADIIISDATSLFQFITVNATTGFFNTRVNFELDGSISVSQVAVPPPCTSGGYVASTGLWTPGMKMRVGVEVLAGSVLRVYKDGVQIFQGHDISQHCNPQNPNVGISQIRNFNANVGTTATFVIDNISSNPTHDPCGDPLPMCEADVFPPGGDGVVNIDDLIQGVINTWGQTQNPPGSGPRPLGDCAPGPDGDCEVDVDDILAIISGWGNCPPITGACCIQGVCSTQTQAICTGSPNFGTYHGNFVACSQVQCVTPPPGDSCVNAFTATSGSNNWNNINANTDGPAAPCAGSSGVRGDVWFKFTATCSGLNTIDTVGTAAPFTDTVLQVFATWDCNPLGPRLACNDDIDTTSGNRLSRASFYLCTGQQVLIHCASKGGTPLSNSGPAVLNISCSLFNNDFCEDAFTLVIGSPMTCTGSIQGSTLEDEPNCLPGDPQPPLGRGRWYRVIGDGTVLTASTCGSPLQFSWDGRLSVYCGASCADATCVVASTDYNCGPGGVPGTGTQETVTWCSRVGQSYWILVSTDVVPLPPEGGFQLLVTSGEACDDALSCPGRQLSVGPANDQVLAQRHVVDLLLRTIGPSNRQRWLRICGSSDGRRNSKVNVRRV